MCQACVGPSHSLARAMLLAQRVWHLQRDFWRHSPSRTRLLLGYGLLVAFSLCGTRLQVALSFASRQVTNAVLDRSEAALSESLFHFAQLVAVDALYDSKVCTGGWRRNQNLLRASC